MPFRSKGYSVSNVKGGTSKANVARGYHKGLRFRVCGFGVSRLGVASGVGSKSEALNISATLTILLGLTRLHSFRRNPNPIAKHAEKSQRALWQRVSKKAKALVTFLDASISA